MKRFQRTIEDFTCENCGARVTGNGYTNHCPNCLWSKHVDIMPGDRANTCQGMMQPIGLETKGGATYLLFKCSRCGHQGRNSTTADDSSDALLAVARSASEAFTKRAPKGER